MIAFLLFEEPLSVFDIHQDSDYTIEFFYLKAALPSITSLKSVTYDSFCFLGLMRSRTCNHLLHSSFWLIAYVVTLVSLSLTSAMYTSATFSIYR